MISRMKFPRFSGSLIPANGNTRGGATRPAPSALRARARAVAPAGGASAARLDPALGPGQARARRLAIATHFRPHLAVRDLAVQLDARRAGGEERAEHADGTVLEPGRRAQAEGRGGVDR